MGRGAKCKIIYVFLLGKVAYESVYLALCDHGPSGVDMDGAYADCLVPTVFSKKERVDVKSTPKAMQTDYNNTPKIYRYAMVVPRSPKLQSLSMLGYTERHT